MATIGFTISRNDTLVWVGRESVSSWPVDTDVGIWEVLCPAVEDLRQRGGLPSSRWQVLLQHEYQDDVAFRREVCRVLGYNSPALSPGGRGDLGIVRRPQPDLGHVHSVLAIGVAQDPGRCYRKHLIDQERCHASSAWRCSAILRLRSIASRLRSIRS